MPKDFKLGDKVVIIENDFTRQVVTLDSDDLVCAVNMSLYYEEKAQLFHDLSMASFRESRHHHEKAVDIIIVNSIVKHCLTGK